ncbi:classical arabinogalactan protein 9-like isoform X2 [Gymnodraco acuticeps]|uniref:Classical arabinogalactan protein 9-like isoform X2 n=1 Tax=Gymnodraco acuticeps TaxID=8218 RepID=A0A6P8VWM8_GYMAC|nr:classical arabinogalactan protein 9-like isoform X2 [Gymnodraco acuticeps]
MPMHAQLSTSAKTCLDNVEAIYKLMVAGWTRLNPDQEEHPDTPTPPQDPPNQLPDGSYILNLVPCDPSPITHNQQPQETADPPPNQAPSTHPPPNQAPSTHPPPNQAPSTHPPSHQVQIMLEPSHQIPPMRQPRKRTKTIKNCSHNHLEVFPVRTIIKTRNRKGGTEHLYDWEPCTICGMGWPPSWQAA